MLYKRHEKINKSYDVIIIGSGLGGLTAANKLAKDGYKVLILEAHNKLGGFATWFFRKNKEFIFDVSLHGFPIGMKKTCRKYWNQQIADSIIQVKDVRFLNPQYKIKTDFTKADYTKKLVEEFKLDAVKVDEFFSFLASMNFYDDQSMTNRQLFEKFFPNRNDVQRFLLEPICYANGSTLDDPAITYGIVFSNFMSKGVYTFEGGTDRLIKLMRDELLKNGVDIKMNSLVDKIMIENSQVRGVCIGEQKIYSKAVLSNANIKTTIEKLCDKKNFTSEFLEENNNVQLNTSSCQVYIALKTGETIDHIGELVFTSTKDHFDTEDLLDMDINSRTYSIYYPEIRPQEKLNKVAIVSSTNARYQDWKDLSESEYKAQKDLMINETVDHLETLIPDIRTKIELIDAATPLTVERYTHHPMGTSFGTKFEGLKVSMNLHKQIDGLFHAGSVGIIMSGWLGAANYGVIQANEIESYIYNLQPKDKVHAQL